MGDEKLQAKWNIDDEVLKELQFYLASCNANLRAYRLEAAYDDLNSARRVLAGVLDDDEISELNQIFHQLVHIKSSNDKMAKVKFYNKVDEGYIKIRRLGHEYGFWLRRSEADIGL